MLPSHKKNERLPPSKKTNLQEWNNSVDNQPGTLRSDKKIATSITGSIANASNSELGNKGRQPEDAIFNQYTNSDKNYSYQSGRNLEKMFDGKNEMYTDDGHQRMNRKPLFGSGSKCLKMRFSNLTSDNKILKEFSTQMRNNISGP